MNRSVLVWTGATLISLLAVWFARDVGVSPPEVELSRPSVTTQPLLETPLETPIESSSAQSSADAPLSASVRREPNIFTAMDGRPFPEVESSPLFEDMERTILSYVSRHPFLALTDLEVQCEASGCVIFMGGRSIPIHELQFGAFAKEQGFEFAAIRERDGTSGYIVVLRR
jgi:hypothetical protein